MPALPPLPPALLLPSPPRPLFLSLTIESGRHFRDAFFPFAPGLTCLIGGRGSGKSTLLLFLLYGIGHALDDRDLEQVEAALGSGRLTVVVCTHEGAVYNATRRFGETPTIRTAAGDVVPVSLHGALFRADFYPQTSIEDIGLDPAAQLVLLDGFRYEDVRRIELEVLNVERRHRKNTEELRRLSDEIAEDEVRAEELPSLEAALAGFATSSGADAALVKKAEDARLSRDKERAGFGALASELGKVRASLDAFARDAKSRLAGAIDPALERGDNGVLVQQAIRRAVDVAGAIETAASSVAAAIAGARTGLDADTRALATAHAAQDDAYQALAREFDVDRERTAARDKLRARVIEVSAIARRLTERKAERATREGENRRLLDELLRLRAERFGIRHATALEVSASITGVKVEVVQAKGTERYFALLGDVVKGAGIRGDLLRKISQEIPPHVLVADAVSGDPTRIMAIDDAKTSKDERALRVLKALRASDRLFELQVAPLDDVPTISLDVGGQGDVHFAPTALASVGQRCTAMVSLALLSSNGSLAIDQPEDHLDNAYLYTTFVKNVRRTAKRRQLIFSTHNANIVCLAGTEQVIALAVKNREGYAAQIGSVEETRALVEQDLEGGADAFLRRSEQYGHTPPRGDRDE
jgi:hypothetical protein